MDSKLKPVKPGLAMVLFGLTFGIALGITFGISEDIFMDFIARGIALNPDLHTPESADKIWRYAQRAHFHATGIAAFSLPLILLLMCTEASPLRKRIGSIAIGLGGLYPLSWLLIFALAPGIGTAAAHGQLWAEILAYIGTGGLLLGLVLLVHGLFRSG